MYLNIIKTEQLKKLNTKRLLNVLNQARAVRSAERLRLRSLGWCCDICKEWKGTKESFEEKVNKPTAHLTAYVNRIKSILATREHIP